MSTTAVPVPPVLATLIGRLAAAVPGRARATFTELLIGAAVTRGGHVTDAILAVGLSRAWTTYYWLLERGRWSWLAVWRALLGALQELFAPPVLHVVVDDTVVERISAGAPGSLIHRNHSAKPNRPRFLRGQGWLCLAAVVERGWRVGAVPLMLRLVRRGTHRGKLTSARFLLRLLGRVRLLLDAWFMRARLIEAALPDGHTVIRSGARARRRPPRDRPRAPRPGAVRGPAAAPAAPSRPAAQVRRADDAGEDRSATDAPDRREPVRQARGRAVPDLPGGGPLPQRPGGACRLGAVGTARPVPRDERGAPVGLHRPGPARDRGHHELRQEVERRAFVRGHEARLGARGRLAAVAPGADALGDDPGRGLRAQPDAGLHRPGPRSGPRRSGALATARHAHGRADPGGPHTAFAWGRPVRPHARDLAKIEPRRRPPH